MSAHVEQVKTGYTEQSKRSRQVVPNLGVEISRRVKELFPRVAISDILHIIYLYHSS